MTLPPEVNPAAKFGRAQEHFEVLSTEVADYLSQLDQHHPYDADTDINPVTRKCVSYLKISNPVPEIRWGLLAGDGMHNLRSALDHVIEAATLAHTGTPLPRTEFPIFDIARRYGDIQRRDPTKPVPRSGLDRVRGIEPRLAAFVERLQPYHYGDSAHRHPLWRLHTFDIIDKHRVIPILGLAGEITHFRVDGWAVHSVRLPPVVRFVDRAPLAEFTLGPGSGPMNVEVEVPVQIRFGQGEPGFAEEVVPVLQDTLSAVRGILTVFLETIDS